MAPDRELEQKSVRARQLLLQGDYAAAESSFRQILAAHPQHAGALHGLGMLAYLDDRWDDSIRCLQSAIELEPGVAEYSIDLAAVQLSAGDPHAALGTCDRALELAPQSVRALLNRGNACLSLGAFAQAIESLQLAVRLSPANAILLNSLGVAQLGAGELELAVNTLLQAIQLDAGSIQAWNNLSHAYASLGDDSKALDAVENVVQLEPNLPGAYLLKASLQRRMKQSAKAAEVLEAAQRRFPEYLPIMRELGELRAQQGRPDDSLEWFRRAELANPDDPRTASNRLLAENYCPGCTWEALDQSHRSWGDRFAPVSATSPRIEPIVSSLGERDRELRIGYLSADLREHPVGFLAIRTVEALAQRGIWQAIYSNHRQTDRLVDRFRQAADAFHCILDWDDAQIAEQIRRDRIDVLLDLSGHTPGGRLGVFALHPAPHQSTWLGYPGSTGMRQMEFLIADRWHIPAEQERWFREKVCRLPNFFATVDPPEWELPVTPLPALSNGHITFACPHNPNKINDQVLRCWSRIAATLPTSRFLFRYDGYDDAAIQERIAAPFASVGFSVSQLLFESGGSRKEMLQAYQRADITVDAFPYSGGLTTWESLWMGVPVVTSPGPTMASRHSYAYLANVGLESCIASEQDNYPGTAMKLAGDLSTLSAIRGRLRQQLLASPIHHYEQFADDFLEMIYRDFKAVHES